MPVLRLKSGYTVKYSQSPWEIPRAPPSRNPSGYPLRSALGISLVPGLYFTMYPSPRHKTDTVLEREVPM